MTFPCLKVTFAGETKYVPLSAGIEYGLTLAEVEAMAQGRISSCEGHMEGLWIYAYTALDAKRDAAEEMYQALVDIARGQLQSGTAEEFERYAKNRAKIALAQAEGR